jgi:hypothetical protein
MNQKVDVKEVIIQEIDDVSFAAKAQQKKGYLLRESEA